MVRSLFLYLSRQHQLRRWMETSSVARRLATRFVAGETLGDAIAITRRLNGEGIRATLDHLGESVESLDAAAEARSVYLQTLDAIRDHQLDANVSLKLTQFGIDLSYEECLANVERLVAKARELGNFVRVDMESSDYTERTLELVRTLFARFGTIGVVIQAYLYRSPADVDALCDRHIRVRLCKGAYLEPASAAFPEKADVDRAFVKLAEALLTRGTFPGIATHDAAIIEAVKTFARKQGIRKDAFEFQMLYGIRRDLQRQLVNEGWGLRLYVPFGRAWYPYYMRRLAERPANLLFILRNLFRS